METSARSSRPIWIVVLLIALALLLAFVSYQAGKRGARPTKADQPQAQAQQWTCPMHPQIITEEPGQCPICGMDLVPMEAPKDRPGEEPVGIPGYAVVEIDPKRQQLIGVVTTSVKRRSLDRALRTVGIVTVDESRLSDVHTKVAGWIDKLYANETGKLVRKGDALLTIYSPDLVSTQQEYLVALRTRERLADSPFPEVRQSGESLLSAARERLRLWDVSQQDIARLEKTGEVRKTLALYAPHTGYIMEKSVVDGMRVMPEMTLLRLADLSRVWVEADVYESELPLVKTGQRAKLSLQSQPGRTLDGRVTYLYPTVEQMTRTVKARLEFPNPGLQLKPGMYADVEIMIPTESQLVIPDQAVMDTGTRKVVFVKTGEGTFIPREVTLGPRSAGHYPVLSGLEAGELVVSSPNFLMDSESRYQATTQSSGGKAEAGEHAGHGE